VRLKSEDLFFDFCLSPFSDQSILFKLLTTNFHFHTFLSHVLLLTFPFCLICHLKSPRQFCINIVIYEEKIYAWFNLWLFYIFSFLPSIIVKYHNNWHLILFFLLPFWKHAFTFKSVRFTIESSIKYGNVEINEGSQMNRIEY
jgi:hypothetical protein